MVSCLPTISLSMRSSKDERGAREHSHFGIDSENAHAFSLALPFWEFQNDQTAHNRTFGLAIRAPDDGHSLSTTARGSYWGN